MGSMDRNTVIGFVLLAILLFLYLFLSTRSSQELQRQRQSELDSLANVKRTQDSLRIGGDTTLQSNQPDTNALNRPVTVNEQLLTLENEVLRISFSNKGGQPEKVELKKYNSFDGKPVILGGTPFDKFSYAVNTGQGDLLSYINR